MQKVCQPDWLNLAERINQKNSLKCLFIFYFHMMVMKAIWAFLLCEEHKDIATVILQYAKNRWIDMNIPNWKKQHQLLFLPIMKGYRMSLRMDYMNSIKRFGKAVGCYQRLVLIEKWDLLYGKWDSSFGSRLKTHCRMCIVIQELKHSHDK